MLRAKFVRVFWDECFKVGLSLRKSLKKSLQYSSATLIIKFIFINQQLALTERPALYRKVSKVVPLPVQIHTATSPNSYRLQAQTVSVARMTEIEGSRSTLVQIAAHLSSINVQVPCRKSWDQSLLNGQCPALYR